MIRSPIQTLVHRGDIPESQFHSFAACDVMASRAARLATCVFPDGRDNEHMTSHVNFEAQFGLRMRISLSPFLNS